MEFTAQKIAELIGGTIEGNPDVVVTRVIKIDEDESGGLGFLANPKYEQFIYSTGADVVIVHNDFKAERELTSIVEDRPKRDEGQPVARKSFTKK